jgi:hypothetical protein
MNKLTLPLILGLLGVLVVGILTGYLYFQKSTFDGEKKGIERDLVNLQSELSGYESANLDKAVFAKETLSVLQEDVVEWSEVIEKILTTTPKDADTREPLVEYSSYSGSQNSKLTISSRTLAGRKAPFTDVADLIRAFEDSPYFGDPFIPSISTNFSEDGELVLAFSFGVDYQAQKDEVDSVPKGASEASAPKASRGTSR